MASYLLDTHIILWYFDQSPELSEKAFNIISDQNHSIFVSVASYWEMAIKSSSGKLKLPNSIEQMFMDVEKANIQSLPILPSHLARLCVLPQHHRDPFDRLIIAQAQAENMVIISRDSYFRLYLDHILG